MTRDVALDHFSYWWRSQKVGKYAMKTGCFSLPVGNIDHLSCLQKIEHPYERRLRHQCPMRLWRTTAHEKG